MKIHVFAKIGQTISKIRMEVFGNAIKMHFDDLFECSLPHDIDGIRDKTLHSMKIIG